jgi:hypothetical protein
MYTHVKNGQQITTPQKVHPPSLAPSPHRETACPGGACHVLGLVLVVCRYMEKCAEMLRKTRALRVTLFSVRHKATEYAG